jgi:hypothetical protein
VCRTASSLPVPLGKVYLRMNWYRQKHSQEMERHRGGRRHRTEKGSPVMAWLEPLNPLEIRHIPDVFSASIFLNFDFNWVSVICNQELCTGFPVMWVVTWALQQLIRETCCHLSPACLWRKMWRWT